MSKPESARVIAEIGINHNGDVETARTLITAAASAGVGAVKFQYRELDAIYVASHREIGDEILDEQIVKNYLSPDSIAGLVEYAHDVGVDAGVSFFNESDVLAFGSRIDQFDFFKVPSAELTNLPLIEALLTLQKTVYISTGGHSEDQIENALDSLSADNWVPMHCISNYPTHIQNPKLGYIWWMHERWRRPIGYSSHDEHYEICLLALQAGADVIERHITFDKQADGLDHTSSSTPDEIRKICEFAEMMPIIMSGDVRREPNQGERMNIQNLGRSFYFSRSLSVGEQLTETDIVYRSPKVGADQTDIRELLGQPLRYSVSDGDPVTRRRFNGYPTLPDESAEFAKRARLGVPVRLHDVASFQERLNIDAFEFHLSYGEALSELGLHDCSPNKTYSIHLPDYIDSERLIDVFAPDEAQREKSEAIIEAVARFADGLQQLTGRLVPVVGSFSELRGPKDEFYARHRQYFDTYSNRGVSIMPQWLPPIAWYFGGSVPLEVFNDENDMDLLVKYQITTCLDICHYLLGANYHGFDKSGTLPKLLALAGHIHIADAQGIDGEGLEIGEGDPENLKILADTLDLDCTKIIEVWQGHLNGGARFIDALNSLAALREHA